MSLQIAILYGSMREARQGIKAARLVDAQLCERGHATCLIDAKESWLPLLDRMHKEYPKGEAPEVMEKLAGNCQEFRVRSTGRSSAVRRPGSALGTGSRAAPWPSGLWPDPPAGCQQS
jgi:hypothetical protein